MCTNLQRVPYILGEEKGFPICSHVLALPARQEQGPLFDVFFAKSVNPILSYFKVIMTRWFGFWAFRQYCWTSNDWRIYGMTLMSTRFLSRFLLVQVHIFDNNCFYFHHIWRFCKPTFSNIIMVQELSYTVTNSVLESWEQIRRIKNYEQVAGVKLFEK